MRMMEIIQTRLLERNAFETSPFLSITLALAALENMNNDLQLRCDNLESERFEQRETINQFTSENRGKGYSKIEAKQRGKISQLQEQLNEKLTIEVESSSATLKVTQDLIEQRDINSAKDATISNLRKENSQQEDEIVRLENDLQEARSHSQLAEKQYSGLKDTIKDLQETNDSLTKENRTVVNSIVTNKQAMMDQMNEMTDMIEKLKKEVNMLQALQKQEAKRGNSSIEGTRSFTGLNKGARQFGSIGSLLPSSSKQVVQAHHSQATCVRYDSSGSDLLATSSEDSTVKIWDTGNGKNVATLRGGNGHVMIGVDICGGLAVGCGSDKTCRVWNTRTERLIHQLAGHVHKITCVRLYNNEKAVLTGSADRSLRVWDINRRTYRQTLTLRHSSTTNCIDVPPGSITAASGHLDGGVRFWDLRTSERVEDIVDLHIGGVTSVHFNPKKSTEILTSGRDSVIKLVDIRTCREVQSFKHVDYRVDLNYSSSALSPDGQYVVAGSGSTGDIFLWSTVNGKLERRLKNHNGVGVVGVSWGRGGSNGQQVSSVDKDGCLVLWS